MSYRITVVIGNNQFHIDGATKQGSEQAIEVFKRSLLWWNPFRPKFATLQSSRQMLIVDLSKVEAVLVTDNGAGSKP